VVAQVGPWATLADSAVAELTLREEPDWDESLLKPLLMLPLWPRHRDTLVSAYLVRRAQRDGTTWADIVGEMTCVWVWIFARDEFHRRMMGHPLGALLWIIAASTTEGEPTWAVPVIEDVERRTTTERLRRTARVGLSLSVANPDPGQRLGEGLAFAPPLKTGVLDDGKIHGLTGEEDPSVAGEEALGLLSVRLAEDVWRLRKRSIADVAMDAMSGRLNFHLKGAKQAVLRGRRLKRERHVSVADPFKEAKSDKLRTSFHTEPEERKQAKERKDPEIIAHDVASVWGGPAESDPVHEAEVAATDMERLVAAVNRAVRLSPAQAKVVRYIINHPEGHRLTYPEIAQGAGQSVRTVNNTIKKLAGNRATLHRIFLHTIFPRQ